MYEGEWELGNPVKGIFSDCSKDRISTMANKIIPSIPYEYLYEHNGQYESDRIQKYSAYKERRQNIVTRNTIQYERFRNHTIEEVLFLKAQQSPNK